MTIPPIIVSTSPVAPFRPARVGHLGGSGEACGRGQGIEAQRLVERQD